MGGVSDVVEKAKEARVQEMGRQHECAKMFQALMARARTAVSRFTNERAAGPLEGNDASYMVFFDRLVGQLEGAAAKMDERVEPDCRDLLRLAGTHFFSHLRRTDEDFDFARVVLPVPKVFHDGMGKEVAEHVDALVQCFAPLGGAPGEKGDGSDDDEDTGSDEGEDAGDSASFA